MQDILIAYFSRKGNNYVNGRIVDLTVGNTEIAARKISELTGGDLFQILPQKPYSSDYQVCTQEAKKDLRDNARPELVTYLAGIDQYNTIILCYPNYWGTMPMPVWTFLEHYEFTGKTVYPLCTHEGSGMGNSEADMKRLSTGASVRAGLPIHGGNVSTEVGHLKQWLNGLLLR